MCILTPQANNFINIFLSATYLLCVLAVCIIAVSLTVWSVKLYNISETPPNWIQAILSCKRGKTETNKPTTLNAEDNTVKEFKTQKTSTETRASTRHEELKKQERQITWEDISGTLDRICFFILLVCTGILNAVLIIGLVSGHVETI